LSADAGLASLADELCRVFVGWKLGDDEAALLALEEGALRIDLRSGECWCDDAPLPPLFIAQELRAMLERHPGAASVDAAVLEALFAARGVWRRGSEARVLEITCRVRLQTPARSFAAEARRSANPPDQTPPKARET